jgi:hypothetical protein
MHTPPPSLDPATHRRLVAFHRRVGERRAAELLTTPRSTLARALARFSIRRATADVIRARLDAIDAAGGSL